MKASAGSIIALVFSVIFAILAVLNGYQYYCSNFFEWIAIFVITSFVSYIGFIIACGIRNILGDVFIASDSLTGLFFKKIFLKVGIHCIAVIIGAYIGCSISYLMLGYYDSTHKNYSEKILERREAAGKKLYFNPESERNKLRPLSKEEYEKLK